MEPYYHFDEGPRAHTIQTYIDEKKGRKYLIVGLLKGHDPSLARNWFLVIHYPSGKLISEFKNIQKTLRTVDYGYNIPYKYRAMVDKMKKELITGKGRLIYW